MQLLLDIFQFSLQPGIDLAFFGSLIRSLTTVPLMLAYDLLKLNGQNNPNIVSTIKILVQKRFFQQLQHWVIDMVLSSQAEGSRFESRLEQNI